MNLRTALASILIAGALSAFWLFPSSDISRDEIEGEYRLSNDSIRRLQRQGFTFSREPTFTITTGRFEAVSVPCWIFGHKDKLAQVDVAGILDYHHERSVVLTFSQPIPYGLFSCAGTFAFRRTWRGITLIGKDPEFKGEVLLRYEKAANKAPEPTPTSVMPHATSRASERRNRTEIQNPARVMPAVVVAHL